MATTGPCPNCGAPTQEEQKFCSQCGYNLTGGVTQRLPTPPTQPERARIAQNAGTTFAPPARNIPSWRSNLPLIAGLVAVLLLLVIGGGMLVLSGGRSPTTTPTPASTTATPLSTATALVAFVPSSTPAVPPTSLPTDTLIPPSATALPSPTLPPTDTAVPPTPSPLPTVTVLSATPTTPPTAAPLPTAVAASTPATPAPPSSTDPLADITTISDLNPSVESDHPYDKKVDKSWVVPGTDVQAGATRLHFTRIDLEEGVDWLIVMDAQDAEMQRFTGNHSDGLWTDPVPGSIIKLRLVTDASVEHWG